MSQATHLFQRQQRFQRRSAWLLSVPAVAVSAATVAFGLAFTSPLRIGLSTGCWPLSDSERGHRAGSVVRNGVMEPPTRQAPPDTGVDTSAEQNSWVECRIEQCDDEECRNFENWVFRKEHAQDYEAFLSIRNLEPAGVLPGRFDSGKLALKASVSCRDRGIDVDLRCTECMRLVIGGPYGARGVAVGAYPPQPEVTGCLNQSKMLPVNRPLAGERWDGNQEVPRQTAFCNTVNVGFPGA
mmetsp:Transcript_44207/g.104656  ORF Transcript_44207/g.104656 Transcript_44207/m.104656 type:complete len:240 (-) Transcript_44207:212-931(-)